MYTYSFFILCTGFHVDPTCKPNFDKAFTLDQKVEQFWLNHFSCYFGSVCGQQLVCDAKPVAH
jgi:hypothetical protein